MKQAVTIVTLLLLTLLCGPTLADTEWTPGVTKGDFVCYEMYGVFTSNNPNDIIEMPQFEQNITEGVRIDIIQVSGSVIYQTYTLYLENETKKFDFKTDLNPNNIGNLSFPERGVPICAANLEMGDYLSTVPLIVNETMIRTYSSGERETNRVSWSTPLDYGDCYFDKKTGMLVELNRTHLYTNPAKDRITAKTDIVKMTDSSFLSPQEDPLLVQSPIIALTALVFLTVSSFLRKERIIATFLT